MSNAGGGIERLLRPVQLLLALHLTTAKAPLLGCDGGISYTVGGLKDGGSTMTVEATIGSAGEAQQAPNDSVDHDGGRDVRDGHDGSDEYC